MGNLNRQNQLCRSENTFDYALLLRLFLLSSELTEDHLISLFGRHALESVSRVIGTTLPLALDKV